MIPWNTEAWRPGCNRNFMIGRYIEDQAYWEAHKLRAESIPLNFKFNRLRTWKASLLAHGVWPQTHELKCRLDPVWNKLVMGWRYSYVECLLWTGHLLCGFQFLYWEIHGIDVKFLSVMMSSVWCTSRGISRKSSSSLPRFLLILG